MVSRRLTRPVYEYDWRLAITRITADPDRPWWIDKYGHITDPAGLDANGKELLSLYGQPEVDWQAVNELKQKIAEANAKRDQKPDVQEFFDWREAWPGSRAKQHKQIRVDPVVPAAAGENRAYVRAALAKEFEKLNAAVAPTANSSGNRNATLYSVAKSIFGFVKAGHVDYEPAYDEMMRVITAKGTPQREAEATLESAWRNANPRIVPAPGGIAPAFTIGVDE